MKTRVAFQGEHGAYSELACMKFFGGEAETLPCRNLKDVFLAVEDDKADFGMVASENSTAGDVYETYDLLLDFSLYVCGEVYLRVEHCLIGRNDAQLADVRKVYSHPQALSQCGNFLDSIRAEQIAVYDTAGAVAMVKKSNRRDEAAIASQLAARLYGMKTLKRNIENDSGNTTRFFVISKTAAKKAAKMKTSIVFSTQHKPGALFHCLEGFAKNKINLTKIASRPMKSAKWEYVFYLDFEGGDEEAPVKEALAMLKQHAEFTKTLGSYTSR